MYKHVDSKCVKIDAICVSHFDTICENLLFIHRTL